MKKGDWIRCLKTAPMWYKGKLGRIVWVNAKGGIHAQFDGHEVRIPLEYIRVVRRAEG
tara:strand:+ start:883 stop:1056 length:174 start_codon:yes stop_codon:yes gene_type:complete